MSDDRRDGPREAVTALRDELARVIHAHGHAEWQRWDATDPGSPALDIADALLSSGVLVSRQGAADVRARALEDAADAITAHLAASRSQGLGVAARYLRARAVFERDREVDDD